MSFEPDATAVRRITRAGDYDLLRKMGSGGFGVVYEARHRQTGLLYAVKRVELTVEDAERFRKEALYPAQIASRSLHVLGVHSFFHDPVADAFYLVTELIPHGDLKTFLAQRPKPLPLARAVHLGGGIAKGLAAIHALGIVHRDLKPANVLMDKKDGQWVPKIADFGLARSHSSISLGEFASSGYAAPEQLDLLSDKPVGPEADLFSFGMVLYELLTGERASPASDLREYGRWIRARRPPPPPSTLRPDLGPFPQIDTLVAALIEFEPSRRTTTAVACTRVLQEALLVLARPDARRQAGPPPVPVSGSSPALIPVPPPVPAPPPAPTPVQVQPLLAPPAVVPPPSAVAKPRSKARRLALRLAIAGVVGLAVLAGSGWWGWRFYNFWDAASRGQKLFQDHKFGDAFPLLREASVGGDAVSQAMLGEILAHGMGRPPDPAEARTWFERAAEQGEAAGDAGLGWGLLTGSGVAADPVAGVAYLRRAADRGSVVGHTWLGYALETGTGAEKNEVQAAEHYRRAGGQYYALYRLGRMHRAGRGGLARSDAEAATHFRRAAGIGHYDSMCELAVLLSNRYEAARRQNPGRGSDGEAKEAVGWFQKAANGKQSCGELGLGYMYYYGLGVPASYDKAVELYESAAAHGDETARSNLTAAMGSWVLPPMFLGTWRQVSGTERRDEIARLRSAGIIDRLGARDVQRLRRIEIDFYERTTLFELEIARANRPRGIYTYIRRANRLVTIDGRSAPISELNATAPIQIDTLSRAIAYLRFFMAAYQGQEGGTFRLVDTGTDVSWLPTAADYDRNSIGSQIHPMSLRQSSAGGWEAVAFAQHRGAIYRATLWLKPDGAVQVLKEETIGTALPIDVERFDDQGLRVRGSS